ncbi:MAG: hypothetical protein K2Q07_09775, partial [Burkholderiaceae bacterium]|nr:hypothetical protein [Burkholderiaceae bacterium]
SSCICSSCWMFWCNWSSSLRWVRRARTHSRVRRCSPRLRTSSNDSAIAAAVAGFGITRLLSYQVAEHLRAGRLQVVLEDCETPALPIHVVHREGRRATQKVRGFIDLAVDALRAHPALR